MAGGIGWKQQLNNGFTCDKQLCGREGSPRKGGQLCINHSTLPGRDHHSAKGDFSLAIQVEQGPSPARCYIWVGGGKSVSPTSLLWDLRPPLKASATAHSTNSAAKWPNSLRQNCNATVPAARGDQGQLSISPLSTISPKSKGAGVQRTRTLGGRGRPCNGFAESQLSFLEVSSCYTCEENLQERDPSATNAAMSACACREPGTIVLRCELPIHFKGC